MKKRWLIFGSVFLVGVVLSVLYINMLSWHRRDSIPVPKYRMDVNLDSAEGFDEVLSAVPPSGFPKLTLRQGAIGTIEIASQRQYTNDTLWVTLRFYGIAPKFDEWIIGFMGNQTLPAGITYSVNPFVAKLSTDEVYLSTLTIAVGPDAQIGSFKLTVGASYTSSGKLTGTGQSFMLEIKPNES